MQKSIAVLLALSIPAALAGQPSLTAKKLGEDHFELLLITDQTADVGVAQRAIWPAAQQLCAGKPARLGHYKFQSAEPMAGEPSTKRGITLQQEVHCEIAAQPNGASPAAAIPHDDDAITKLTIAYLGAKDRGNYSEAYGQFGDSMKASTSFESWSGKARSFNESAGKAISRKVKKITWYDNPPSAPAPGIYAAADYESAFEKMRVQCGYVVWLGGPDHTFTIVREEENFITKEAAAKMEPERIKAFAEQFGCEAR